MVITIGKKRTKIALSLPPHHASMKILTFLLLLLLFISPLHALLVNRPVSERSVCGIPSPTRLQLGSPISGFGGFVDVEEIASTTPIERAFPFVSRLAEVATKPGKTRDVLSFWRNETRDIRRIFLFAAIAYALPILGRYGREGEMEEAGRDYYETKTYHVLNHISQGFTLSAIITFGESILEFFLGRENPIVGIATTTASTITFGIWSMYRVKVIKNIVLEIICSRFRMQSKMLVRFYRRVTNYVLYLTTCVIILDSLGFQYQKAIGAISVFGGFGTLVFSLASKDIASQLLSGFTMSLSEPFVVGDKILLNDGSVGTVEQAGPLRTIIRGGDEILLNMPNAELENMRFSNLSTALTSQVKQEISLAYEDIDNVSNLVNKIRSEIKASCPSVITDGSRPFRVHLSSFEGKSYTISVDCRLNVPPYSDEYYDNREKVLKAIAKAAS